MAVSEIRYDPESVAFCVGEERVVAISRDDAVVAALEAVADVSVASFERALADYEEQDAATASLIFLADVPVAEFDPDTSAREVWLSFLGGGLTVQVGHGLDAHGGSSLDVPALLAPRLDRHRAELDGDFRDDQGGHRVQLYLLALVGDARSMSELYSLGVDAQALLDAASGAGALTAATARNLIAGGRASALLGQPESTWIDAKGVPHRTDSEVASFERGLDTSLGD